LQQPLMLASVLARWRVGWTRETRVGCVWESDELGRVCGGSFTNGNKMTSIGNDLIGHYRTYLATYELKHTADLSGGPLPFNSTSPDAPRDEHH
jgi:hypothetical protein